MLENALYIFAIVVWFALFARATMWCEPIAWAGFLALPLLAWLLVDIPVSDLTITTACILFWLAIAARAIMWSDIKAFCIILCLPLITVASWYFFSSLLLGHLLTLGLFASFYAGIIISFMFK
ncbi:MULTISPECIES: hypothetical protein [Vibrio]|uniref:hypothetical protein n=1 Tax=Vibrio TaxID=662 RepID=UPI00159EDFB6|nr:MULTISPECIES: hypothetical protein [Vibrio]